jgi:hypothetical protein
MDNLPLTRPALFEEIPFTVGTETLFPELPPAGMRPVEVTVTLPGRPSAMHLVVAEEDAAAAFGLAFRACTGVEEFEISARRYRG